MSADAAGICSIEVGGVRLTYVPDGIQHVRAQDVYAGSSEGLWQEQRHLLDDDGWLVLSLGALLIEGGGRMTLVDLAFGPVTADIAEMTGGEHVGDIVGGALLENLRAVGVSPEDVDTVLYSHLHPDHVGWAAVETPDGPRPTFPRATHMVSRVEWEYWTSGAGARSPYGPGPAQVAVIGERLELVEDGAVPVRGVNVMMTPGHTPGHCSFVVSSAGERAVLLGDAVHCPLELGAAELEFVYDVDPALARRSRERIEQALAVPHTMAAGAHFPDLVFGRVLAGGRPPGLEFPAAQRRLPDVRGRRQ